MLPRCPGQGHARAGVEVERDGCKARAMDPLLLLLLAALALTAGLFVSGIIVYPFGVLVLLLLTVARTVHLKSRR